MPVCIDNLLIVTTIQVHHVRFHHANDIDRLHRDGWPQFIATLISPTQTPCDSGQHRSVILVLG